MSPRTYGKCALRVTDVQAKVIKATSNDPGGPSGARMNEIAQMTYNKNDFNDIVGVLYKRLNDKGKNWHSVFKSLTIIDYLLHAGSEYVVVHFLDHPHIIKRLEEFQYIDKCGYGKDQGASVRQKAKEITNLLMDEARLRRERHSWAERTLVRNEPLAPRGNEKNVQTRGAEDDDLRRAIEESNRTLAAEQSRDPDADLLVAMAIQLSEEEEARRKATLTDSDSLFDELDNDSGGQNNGLQPQFTMQPQLTSFNLHQQQAQNWQEAMQAEWARRQQEWIMLQRQQQREWMMQQQLQLRAQQEEWMRQQLALQQTAPPVPLVPSVSPNSALSGPVPPLPLVNASPNYVATTPGPPLLPISAHSPVQRGAMNRPTSVDADPPPPYSSTDRSTS